ncbi:MAG: metallophosphoesterase family protein [Chloroflexi bacterium]|nr:metallophosphoesterase family protein [Chloroflexota bacterium]
MHRIGVISDTHGLLRPEAVQALQGVAQILHAGDVGKPEILTALAGIAPVTAVRGNVDNGAWARDLPLTAVVQVGPVGIFMLHDLNELDIQPLAAGIQVVVSGHTHQPLIEQRRGVLYVNPGSAGPRRFRMPVTLALLEISAAEPRARLVPLEG